MTNNDEQLHWLQRPATIRKLWIAFIALLVVVVLAQTVIYIKGYFVVDGWFGFAAVYGFGCCLLMVLVAKALGKVLKRPQDYYAQALDPRDQGIDAEKHQHGRVGEHSDGV